MNDIHDMMNTYKAYLIDHFYSRYFNHIGFLQFSLQNIFGRESVLVANALRISLKETNYER